MAYPNMAFRSLFKYPHHHREQIDKQTRQLWVDLVLLLQIHMSKLQPQKLKLRLYWEVKDLMLDVQLSELQEHKSVVQATSRFYLVGESLED